MRPHQQRGIPTFGVWDKFLELCALKRVEWVLYEGAARPATWAFALGDNSWVIS